MFRLKDCKKETELCTSGELAVSCRGRDRLEQTANAVKVGVYVQGL